MFDKISKTILKIFLALKSITYSVYEKRYMILLNMLTKKTLLLKTLQIESCEMHSIFFLQ